jgi:hypothetical protein
MTEADKDAAVRAFQEDPTVTLFIGSITAAGVGITLTASSHVVMAELDWRPGIVSQAEDRTHRIGQADAVLVQHLVLEGSLDAKMVKTIVRKQDVADRVLDKGAAMVVGAEPVLAVELGSVLDNSDAAACGDALPVSGTSDGAGVRVAVSITVGDGLRELVHQGLKQLSGMDGDFASELNGAGYSKMDCAFGHALADRKRLSDRQTVAGIKLVRRYKRQLGEGYAERLASYLPPMPGKEALRAV